MNLETIYFFDFASVSADNQGYLVNQTWMDFAVNSTGMLQNGNSNAIIGSYLLMQPYLFFNSTKLGLTLNNEASDTLFGPYYLSCSGNQISTFLMENGLSGLNTIIIAFRLRSSASLFQTILSFQSSTSTIFRIQYDSHEASLIFMSDAGSTRTILNTIQPGKTKF